MIISYILVINILAEIHQRSYLNEVMIIRSPKQLTTKKPSTQSAPAKLTVRLNGKA